MVKRAIERIVKEALSLGEKALVEPEAKEMLKLSSIPVPRFQVVKDVRAAVEAAESIGYPVVLKVVSADIVHKRYRRRCHGYQNKRRDRAPVVNDAPQGGG